MCDRVQKAEESQGHRNGAIALHPSKWSRVRFVYLPDRSCWWGVTPLFPVGAWSFGVGHRVVFSVFCR